MYPIESVRYLSVCLVPLFFRSGCHPFLVLYGKIIALVDALLGHDGYDDPGRGTYFHQLHHAHFECNYGTQAVPLDWIFGWFEDGRRYMRSYATGQQLHQNTLSDEGGSRSLTMEEVALHNTRQDCWIVLSGLVFDVTDFLSEHPGGEKAILSKAGSDATLVFNAIHNKSGGMALVKQRAPNAQIGVLLDQGKGKDSSSSVEVAHAESAGLLISGSEDVLVQIVINGAFAIMCTMAWSVLMGTSWY
jgi:cytochrome b involved in lipid metabolism